jgi:tetratricopeptide (TPR) repeat protein
MPQELPPAPSTLPMAPTDRSAAWQRLASLRPGVSLRPGGTAPPVSFIPPPARMPQVSIRPATPTSLLPAADDAQGRLRRAEQLLGRGRHDDAITEVKALIDEGIKGADVLALHAHALFEKHAVQQEDGLPRQVLEAIKRASEAEPDHPRTLFVKGLVAKAAGDNKKALAYFKRVLQSDPKHLEAQREVRLAKLRMEDA